MAVVVGDWVNRFNLSDDATLELRGIGGVHSLSVDSRTFVYATGFLDDGLSGFELHADGTLTDVANISDDDMLRINDASQFTSATVDGVTYLYVNGTRDWGISGFRVAADGSLTNIENVSNDAVLELAGSFGKMSTVTVGSDTFLIASGLLDSGISVFRIDTDGSLINIDNVDGTPAWLRRSSTEETGETAHLFGAMSVSTAAIGGSTFVFVAALGDYGVTSFKLDENGALTIADSVFDSENPALELAGAFGTATATVGGATYLFVSGLFDRGVSVFAVDASGLMTNVFNLADTADLGLNGAAYLNTFVMGGQTFLSVAGIADGAVSTFAVGGDGSLANVQTIFDNAELNLYGAIDSTFALSGGLPFLIAGGAGDHGLSVFEIGGGRDLLTGTDSDDTLMGLGRNDVLTGMAGDDAIMGGAGFDVAGFSKAFSSYTIAHSGSATKVAANGDGDGTDTLTGVELLSFSNVTVRVAPNTDFTGELSGDLLLRSQSAGDVVAWQLTDGQYAQSFAIGSLKSSVSIVGDGDFNQDGTSDLLLRDSITGQLSTWQIKNGSFQASVVLGGIGANVEVAGTGDLDSDGVSDVLLRDRSSGEISIWKVNADNSYGGSFTLGGVGANFEIAGVGDMTHDGFDDVLLRDTTTGALIVWQVEDNALGNSSSLGGIGSDVDVVDIVDFSGDANEDLLLRNRATGEISYWTIDTAASFAGSTQIGGVPSSYEVVGARDIDHNGYADVLLRDTNTGAIGAFATNEGQYQQFYDLGGANSDWLLA